MRLAARQLLHGALTVAAVLAVLLALPAPWALAARPPKTPSSGSP